MSGRFSSIHGDPNYINYKFKWDHFTLADFSLIVWPLYMIPTIIINIRMIRKVWKVRRQTHSVISPYLFVSFLLVQFANYAVTLTDIIAFRISTTGLITSWCASTDANHYLKAIYMIVFFSNYSSRIQPAIFCTIRALIVFFPRNHEDHCRKVMKYLVPTTLLIPIVLVLYMIPQLGFCTQMVFPFEFGQVGITIDMKGPINEIVHLTTSMICMSITVSANIATLYKIRHIIFVRKAVRPMQKSYKAELSLSATMLSLLVPFTTDVIYAIVSITRQSVLGYVLSIRPFALDFATVIVAWIFYLTHPLFRKRKIASITSISTGRVVFASDKSVTH